MIKVKALDPFKILYNLPDGTNLIIIIGGRGGAKSYEVSKFIAFSSTIKTRRCLILRDEKELVRESILNEVLLRYDTANTSGVLDSFYERLETGIKDRSNDNMLVFTKGFRASSLEKRANLKSISNVDIAVIEEAEDIRDEEKFSTFADSIRKEGALIIIVLNTPDIGHWILKRYFNLEPAIDTTGKIVDGYYNIIPKDLPGFLCIKTSFEDNPHLPNHIVENYNNYGNPDSHLYNLHYYLTAILGLASTGRKGQVIKKAKPIKLADYLKLPFKEYYGLDFGTARPAALCGVKIDKNTVYARQLNYLPLATLDIAKKLCQLDLSVADLVIADSADPKSITKLNIGYQGHELSKEEFLHYPLLKRGFNVIGARKGDDSIEYGLGLIESMNLFVVEESLDFWNEIFNYIYDQDKNGNYTNKPIKAYNHLIDGLRYVVMHLVELMRGSGYTKRN